jgi:hypothetical protein
LTNISQNKNQAMFFNHFTDTVFHLTDHNQVRDLSRPRSLSLFRSVVDGS